jgi:hypothetical protein
MHFDNGQDFENHLRTHPLGRFNDAQILLLTRQLGVPDPMPLRTCPFFCETPPRARDYTQLKGEGEVARSVLAAGNKIIQEHVAQHLVKIASYSLPLLDDGEGDVASDEALPPSTHRHSIGESDITMTVHPAALEEPWKEFKGTSCHDQEVKHEKRDPSEWDFMGIM